MDTRLLERLVCPLTKGRLHYDRESQQLISVQAKLAFPIIDGIPIMMELEALELSSEQYERWSKR
ncbi:MAG: Trm112 family protein [Pseudomonadota bacterium]